MGFGGELSDVLVQLRRHGTKLVLGLRDALDDPAAAAEQGTPDKGDLAVALLYDEVWVYGDETVHDPVAECTMPELVAAKVRRVGYLARGRPLDDAGHRPLGGSLYVLVTAGGGEEDGRALARRPAAPAGTTASVMGPVGARRGRRQCLAGWLLREALTVRLTDPAAVMVRRVVPTGPEFVARRTTLDWRRRRATGPGQGWECGVQKR